MYYALRFGFGIGMVPINAFQVYLKSLPNFHGENPTTFHLIFVVENPAALRLRCVLPHQMLFSQSIQRKNMAMGMPYFLGKNLAKFSVWCAMAHR